MRPLGISDVIHKSAEYMATTRDDYWLWCRRHEQAHTVGEKCQCEDCPLERGPHHPDTDCIDIGPFMSRNEAERLGYIPLVGDKPLGIEVEQ